MEPQAIPVPPTPPIPIPPTPEPVQPPTQPTPVPEQPINKASQRWLIISSVVFLLVAIVLVAFKILLKNRVTTPPEPTPLSTEAPAKVDDETANWKEYKNNAHNYGFKYPDDWQISLDKQAPNEIINLSTNLCNISIYSGNAKTVIPPQVNVVYTKTMIPVGDAFLTRATYDVDNLSVEFLESAKPSRINMIVITAKINNGVSDRKSCQIISSQILSTFKFLEQSNTEGKFCGGIAANLPENQCPDGFYCKLDGDYPDASGVCTKK